MRVSARDKRALMILAVTVATALPFVGLNRRSKPALTAIPQAENRLTKLQDLAAALPLKEDAARLTRRALDRREQGLIGAADDKLGQEKLLNIIEKVAQSQAPPLEIRNKELPPSRMNGDYGEVLVSVSTTCRMEQLINFVSDLTAQPEAVATEELHIYGVHPENKLMQIRLTIGGLVKSELIPQQKSLNEF